MSATSSIDMCNVLKQQITGVLDVGSHKTTMLYDGLFEEYEADELAAKAEHVVIRGEDTGGERTKKEQVALHIGNGTLGYLASVRAELDEGIIEYTIRKPFDLMRLIDRGAALWTPLVSAEWLMEPILEDTQLELQQSNIPTHSGMTSFRPRSRTIQPTIVYKGRIDDAEAGRLLVDGTIDLVAQEIDETRVEQATFIDRPEYYVTAQRAVAQNDGDDIPYEATLNFQYFAPDINLSVDAIELGDDKTHRFDMGAVTKTREDVSGMHGVRLDLLGKPEERIKVSSVAFPVQGIQLDNPLVFVATQLHRRLDQVLADVA